LRLFLSALVGRQTPPCLRHFSATIFFVSVHRTSIDPPPMIRFPPGPTRTSGPRHRPLPCFYPHHEWVASGSGASWIRFKAQVHHCCDELALLGLPSIARLIDLHSFPSHRKKAVDVVVCQTFWIGSVLASSTPVRPSETPRVQSSSRFRRFFPFPWPARLPPLSVPTWQGAAAHTHTPLH
jgi:hypothetical protein